ncbi:lysylphosphatidylglycerol synthase domain-containing protein, partial [Roseateles sp.]|uniref:lysylphosphatidylglycerol synthase domain-containing protein n=1 Tax=Roseateles sp. TaxID=1971397 RepID=UPI003BA4622A
PDVSAWVVAGIFGAAVLGGALTFLPGGLGGTELLMLTLLTTAGLQASSAAAATAVCRLATLWFGFFLGLSVLPLLGALGNKARPR